MAKIGRTYRLEPETVDQIQEIRTVWEEAGFRVSDAAIVEKAVDLYAAHVIEETESLADVKRIMGVTRNDKGRD